MRGLARERLNASIFVVFACVVGNASLYRLKLTKIETVNLFRAQSQPPKPKLALACVARRVRIFGRWVPKT